MRMLLRRLFTNTFTHISPNPISPLHFSTLHSSLHSKTKNSSKIDETHVLAQLSDLFPISIPKPTNPSSQFQIRSPDDFLPPQDKFRGVFLQKLRSKSSIYSALSSVGVELNDDVFAKVLNEGSLCGESMVHFLNWAIENRSIAADVFSYNVVVKAMGRKKFFAHMMGVLDDMMEKGIGIDSETLFVVMDSHLRARQVSRAVKVFGVLGKYGLVLDEETLRVALKCLCRRSHVGAACTLFNKTRGKVEFVGVMYNVIVEGWSKMGRVDEVEKFLKAMVDDGVEPDCVTYGHVIECFGRAGRMDDAVKVYEFLEEQGSECSIFTH